MPTEISDKPISRIAVIGVGQVGGAAAYALTLGSVAREILLVDVDTRKRNGQVRDLSDAAYSRKRNTRVREATYEEASQCDIVVITAGSKFPLGETNMQHLYHNIAVVRNVIEAMKPFRSDTILLLVSNPVDVVTSLARELSGLPSSQVLGSGTFLDSVRLRGLVADKIGVAAPSIDVYVLGVHGGNQVVGWSLATIGGVPIHTSLPTSVIDRAELEKECKQRSQGIIQAKGAMPFGVGSAVSSICASILFDKRNVRAVSHYQPDYGCCLSMPVILGRKGTVGTIKMPLSSGEEAAIADSANTLRTTMSRIRESTGQMSAGVSILDRGCICL